MNTHSLVAQNSMEQLKTLLSANVKNGNHGAATAGRDFSSILAGIDVDITVTKSRVNTEPQTIEDVKREFHAFLDSLQLSRGLSGTAISVNVTEAAFAKMLVDPEYKQRMMDLCERDLCDPAWNKMGAMGIAPSDMVVTIDADVENEYRASSYGSAYKGKADEAANAGDSFWTRRAKRGKAAREESERLALERKEMLAFLQTRALQKKAGVSSSFAGFASTGSRGASSFFAEIASGLGK